LAAPELDNPALLQVALNGLCPRCQAKTLFAEFAHSADHCPNCGLDFSSFNVGNGSAAFLTLILGSFVTALAIALELAVHPALWIHVLIWIPVTAAGVLLSVRIAKGMMMAAKYRKAAREGRIRSVES
jgi:uncharacterized protein (DUF983 family)